MVLVAGPRQVGKTTLALAVLRTRGPGVHLIRDNQADRREIRAAHRPGSEALVVLDEIHKYRSWKRWLKGEYDKHRERLRLLVTGRARLDVYRRGGVSLQGRYHHYLRDTTGREVDFLVTLDRIPWFAVEVKLTAREIDPALRYYRDKLRIPWTYQVVLGGDRDFVEDGVGYIPAHLFLAALV